MARLSVGVRCSYDHNAVPLHETDFEYGGIIWLVWRCVRARVRLRMFCGAGPCCVWLRVCDTKRERERERERKREREGGGERDAHRAYGCFQTWMRLNRHGGRRDAHRHDPAEGWRKVRQRKASGWRLRESGGVFTSLRPHVLPYHLALPC